MEHEIEKDKIISKLIQAKIIIANNLKHKNPNGYHKPFCWKTRLIENDLLNDWNNYSTYYRSEDEAWYCILNNCEVPNCPICGNKVKFYTNQGFGFNTTCENCSANSLLDKREKCRQTNLNKSEIEKEKINLKRKQTNLERYGEENYQAYGTDSFKQKLFSKYGDTYYNNREKFKQTCLKRYGVTTNLLLNSENRSKKVWEEQYTNILIKRQSTCLKRYGVPSPNSLAEIISKMQNTKKSKISKIEEANNCRLQRNLIKEFG